MLAGVTTDVITFLTTYTSDPLFLVTKKTLTTKGTKAHKEEISLFHLHREINITSMYINVIHR